ncbi:ergothioneine biosynthesis protein EgtB [Novosphingobium resinovorum]|uniref:ergothioneine biosynthesis protein EgtB n=1 Tax=Novosphingobium TaxID=165696 RepID=UPI001B3C8CF7|nr:MULTISPECIES: ergothioneine biosynthesis protein EgtB [Novosphingobium]MBF7013310.1 ergothioneine biosynthesis protein EgtB [Novosphingobium sp. HR1a]WJM25461.1 ergothioneine biosynthesis protein EgtB [Novosphingobium resinovorum]
MATTTDRSPLVACPAPQAERLAVVRCLTETLAAPLSDADATIQSMPDASPAKWHLAHTTWFFETFVLRDHLEGYRLFDETWPFLFNSYYEAEGPRHARPQRGMLSRPSLDEVLAYRAHVDAHVELLLDRPELAALIELGLNHEQQHQELMLTDVKHALSLNPLAPAYAPLLERGASPAAPVEWQSQEGGRYRIGHEGGRGPGGFAFDNESPAHDVLLEPFALARRLVTNREWAEFIADGGYRNPALWLSDGWAWINAEGIAAPLYWRGEAAFTLSGLQPIRPEAPVTHVSCYEADAFATWAGHRLPTEFEWEVAAASHDPVGGAQLDEAVGVHPQGSPGLFGDCWQWTRSAYLPYPRFRPAAGAVGEYNGKFMSGQCVLKGASCATPRGHSRATYRNFFPPEKRWQFTGVRLAKDL